MNHYAFSAVIVAGGKFGKDYTPAKFAQDLVERLKQNSGAAPDVVLISSDRPIRETLKKACEVWPMIGEKKEIVLQGPGWGDWANFTLDYLGDCYPRKSVLFILAFDEMERLCSILEPNKAPKVAVAGEVNFSMTYFK